MIHLIGLWSNPNISSRPEGVKRSVIDAGLGALSFWGRMVRCCKHDKAINHLGKLVEEE